MVTLTSFGFFLSSSGLESVSAASLAVDLPHHPVNSQVGTSWLQPCGSAVSSTLKKQPQRHSAHRSLKRVRTQMRVAQNHFKKDLKEVQDLYVKVYKVLKEQYSLTWLPEKQLEWYRREVWCLEKGKKAERALPRLHDALQRFAITFYCLRNFHLFSDIDSAVIMLKRNEIIDAMHREILRLLCEVESAIINLGLKIPNMHSSVIVTESLNWAKTGDMTLMLIQDWGVLRLYRTFLNDWMRAFRNATAIGSGVCDPSKIKPLDMKPRNRRKFARNKLPNSRDVKPMRKHNFTLGQNSSLPLASQNGSLLLLGQNGSLPLPGQNASLPLMRQRKGPRASRLTKRKQM